MEYTVKQIAELLDVTKPTVQRAIKEKEIDPDRIEKNKYRYYSKAKTEEIIKKIKPDFDVSVLSESVEKNRNTATNEENTAKFVETPQNDTVILSKMLDMLEDELKKKDRELEKKDKQLEKKDQTIEKLQNDIKEAYQQIGTLAGQASYITAADKTAQIMDKKAEAAAEDQDQEEQQELPKTFKEKLKWLFNNK